LYVESTATATAIVLFHTTSTISSATFAAFDLWRSGQNAVNQGVGCAISLQDSAGNKQEYGYFGAFIEDPTSGAENGTFVIATTRNAANRQIRMRVFSDGNISV